MHLTIAMPDDDLTTDEREAIAAQYRADLEDEHTARQIAQERRRERARARTNERQEQQQVQAAAEIKEAVRAEFYRDKGYQKYIDSAGRDHWLTPEEYEWRMRARTARDQRRRSHQPSIWVRRRTLMLYAGATILAVLLGLFLVT